MSKRILPPDFAALDVERLHTYLPTPHAAQYSFGKSNVVTDRSHSVIIQIHSPSDVR